MKLKSYSKFSLSSHLFDFPFTVFWDQQLQITDRKLYLLMFFQNLCLNSRLRTSAIILNLMFLMISWECQYHCLTNRIQKLKSMAFSIENFEVFHIRLCPEDSFKLKIAVYIYWNEILLSKSNLMKLKFGNVNTKSKYVHWKCKKLKIQNLGILEIVQMRIIFFCIFEKQVQD